MKIFVKRFYLREEHITLLEIKGKEKIREFINIFAFLNRIFEEGILHFNDKMMYIENIDYRYMYIKLEYRKRFFDKYWSPFCLDNGISIKNFLKAMKMKNTDNMQLGISIKNMCGLNVISNDSKSGMKITKFLRKREVEVVNIIFQHPEMDLKVSIKKQLWDSIIINLDISRANNKINIHATNKFLIISNQTGIRIKFDLQHNNEEISFKFYKSFYHNQFFNFECFLGIDWKRINTENPIVLIFKEDHPMIMKIIDPHLDMTLAICPIK